MTPTIIENARPEPCTLRLPKQLQLGQAQLQDPKPFESSCGFAKHARLGAARWSAKLVPFPTCPGKRGRRPCALRGRWNRLGVAAGQECSH